jgi:hypothetical protein
MGKAIKRLEVDRSEIVVSTKVKRVEIALKIDLILMTTDLLGRKRSQSKGPFSQAYYRRNLCFIETPSIGLRRLALLPQTRYFKRIQHFKIEFESLIYPRLRDTSGRSSASHELPD